MRKFFLDHPWFRIQYKSLQAVFPSGQTLKPDLVSELERQGSYAICTAPLLFLAPSLSVKTCLKTDIPSIQN